MNWRQLKSEIDEMSPDRIEDDVSIYDGSKDEFISGADGTGTVMEVVHPDRLGDGVLDEGHYFLIVNESEVERARREGYDQGYTDSTKDLHHKEGTTSDD